MVDASGRCGVEQTGVRTNGARGCRIASAIQSVTCCVIARRRWLFVTIAPTGSEVRIDVLPQAGRRFGSGVLTSAVRSLRVVRQHKDHWRRASAATDSTPNEGGQSIKHNGVTPAKSDLSRSQVFRTNSRDGRDKKFGLGTKQLQIAGRNCQVFGYVNDRQRGDCCSRARNKAVRIIEESECGRQVRLRIHVDQVRANPKPAELHSERRCAGRLRGTSLLIGDGNSFHAMTSTTVSPRLSPEFWRSVVLAERVWPNAGKAGILEFRHNGSHEFPHKSVARNSDAVVASARNNLAAYENEPFEGRNLAKSHSRSPAIRCCVARWAN